MALKHTSIRVGEPTPDMNLVDTFGKKIQQSDKPYVLYAFLRYAGCPYCNLSIHRLAVEYPLLLNAGCDVVAFVQSPPDSIQKNIYKRHKVRPEFPIVADQEMTYYKKFGVSPKYTTAKDVFLKDIPHWVHSVRDHGFKQTKIDGSLFIAPALFVAHKPSKKIVFSDYKSNLFEHETFSPIYDKLLTYA